MLEQNKYFRHIRTFFFCVFLLVNLPICTYANQNNQLAPDLLKLEKIIKQLKGGENHTYLVKLKSNDFIDLSLEQRGIDVVIRLFTREGKQLVEVDSTNGAEGTEALQFISEIDDEYKIEISSLDKGARVGNYKVQLNQLNPATQQDKQSLQAFNLSLEITKLIANNRYEEATPLAEKAITILENITSKKTADLALAYYNLGNILYNRRQYDKAQPILEKASEIQEKLLGKNSLDLAITYTSLANIFYNIDDYNKAEPLYKKALEIREKVLGQDNLDTVFTYSRLGETYYKNGKLKDSSILLERALLVRKTLLSQEHPDIALSYLLLGNLYQVQEEYSKSEGLYKHALEIQENAGRGQEPLTATILTNLGRLYRNQGDFSKIESILQKGLEIREKYVEQDPLNLANVMTQLGLFYEYIAEYDKAKMFLEKALEIQEGVLGDKHSSIADFYQNLGILYRSKGEYDKADIYYQKAIAISEDSLGQTHIDTSNVYYNAGVFYDDKGDLDKAEELVLKALKIRETILEKNHFTIAVCYNSLGSIYDSKKEYNKAISFYQKALEIAENNLDGGNPYTAVIINNLATTYRNIEDYQKAEIAYEKVLNIYKKNFQENHPLIATFTHNLAVIYSKTNRYNKAEAFYKRAVEIRENTSANNYPELASAYNGLAAFYYSRGNIRQAIDYNQMGGEIREKEFIYNLQTGSEKQKLLYINKTANEQDQTISLHLQAAPTNLQAAKAAMTLILRRKGRALDAMTNTISNLRNKGNKEDLVLLDQLAQLRGKLSAETLSGSSSKESLDSYKKKITEIKEQIEEVENKISNRSYKFKLEHTITTLENTQKAIPDNSVLIEYISYYPYIHNARSNRHYAVYVLDNLGNLNWQDLGRADIIDKQATEFRKSLIKQPSQALSRTETNLKPRARKLDQLIMQPIRKFLGNRTRLLISPDSNLNLIPFDALVDEKNNYLVEHYEISYLTSGRDLLRLANNNKVNSETALTRGLIIANPEYGNGKGPKIFNINYSALSPLLGTAKEGEIIHSIFPNTELVTGKNARKEVLIHAKSPEVLHIATHGFFLTDKGNEKTGKEYNKGKREISRLFVQEDLDKTNLTELKKSNPLLRSWLFFSGANSPSENQSILTSLEAVSLNLLGTKLVVLSACDTGLGEVKNGESVYGLRRALVLAGSETQVTSLWPVSDTATRDLMIGYYKNLKAGEGRSSGLRKVRLEFLKKAKQAHPYYWASFIQSGEWANLDGKR